MTQAIYVMAAQDRVKVGISKSPRIRRLALSTDTKIALEISYSAFPGNNNARVLEKRAHELLSDHQLGGEWFSASAGVAISAVFQAAHELGFNLSYHKDINLPILFRVKPELRPVLEDLARDQNRSLSNLIETIIVEWMKQGGLLPPAET